MYEEHDDMTGKLVSILIPAYNSGAWIDATLQSAIRQSWPTKEIIVVDDGSSDDTLARARRYASDSIKVVSQANSGASAARNHAYRLAQGDYLQWLDADDLLEPDKIAYQMAQASEDADPRQLYSGAFGEFYCDTSQARFIPTSLWRNLRPVEYFSDKFNGNCWFNPSAWLISRELAEMAGGWNEDLSLDDDGEYFCRLVAKSSGITFVGRAKSFYRRGNASSLSRSNSRRACESLVTSLHLCIDEYLGLEDSPASRAASVGYLQMWVTHTDLFRGQNEDLLEDLTSLARRLGGTLENRAGSQKYRLVRKVLGEQGEIQVRHFTRLCRFKLEGWMEFLRMRTRAVLDE